MSIARGAQRSTHNVFVPTMTEIRSCRIELGSKSGPHIHTLITAYATKLDRVPGSVAACVVIQRDGYIQLRAHRTYISDDKTRLVTVTPTRFLKAPYDHYVRNGRPYANSYFCTIQSFKLPASIATQGTKNGFEQEPE